MIRNKKAEGEILAVIIILVLVMTSICIIGAVASEQKHVTNPYYHSENNTMECWYFIGYPGYPGYMAGYYPYGYYPIGWIWIDNYMPIIMWMSCTGINNPQYYPSVLSGQYTDSRYVPSYFPSNPSSDWTPADPAWSQPSDPGGWDGGSGGTWNSPNDPGGWDGGSSGGWDSPSDPGGWDGGSSGGWDSPTDPGGWDSGGWDSGSGGGGWDSGPSDSGGW